MVLSDQKLRTELNSDLKRPGFKLCSDILYTIIEEEIKRNCKSICTNTLYLANSLNENLRKSIANAVIVANGNGNKRFLKLSGRADVINGTLKDARKVSLPISLTWTLPTVELKDNFDGLLLVDNAETFSKLGHASRNVRETKLLELFPKNFVHTEFDIKSIIDKEIEHFQNIFPISISTDRLHNNVRIGRITVTRFLPAKNQLNRSLLVSGTSTARIMVRSINWTGIVRLDESFVTASPAVDRSLRCPIVDIRFNHFNSDTIVSLTERGDIAVWSLNCISGLVKNSIWSNGTKISSSSKSKLNARLNTLDCLFDLKHVDTRFSFSMEEPSIINLEPKEDPGFLGTWRKADTKKKKSSLPSIICFHPSFNILSSQTSFVLGFVDGDIVKYNMNSFSPITDSYILYPDQPAVEKEYIHPQAGPKGFILTSGKMDQKGCTVYREIFHYHKCAVIFLDVLCFEKASMISVDVSGKVAVWKYEKDQFCGKYWYCPTATIQLVFNYRKYGVIGEMKLLDPSPEQLRQLQLRSRTVTSIQQTEKNITEVYYPLYSREGEEEVWQQFSCDFVESDGRVDPGSHRWMMSTATVEDMQYQLQSCKISPDHIEVVFHISSTTSGKAVHHSFATLMLETMEFLQPAIRIVFPLDNAVVDYCIGPVNKETLTRFIFVLTAKWFIHVYSSCTAHEVRNKSFPLLVKIDDFSPTSIALCHSQRVLALSDPKKEHINCYVLQNKLDGIHVEDSTVRAKRNGQVNIALMESVAVSTIRATSSDHAEIRNNDFEDRIVLQVSDIIDDILLRVHKQTERHKRTLYLDDVCGDFGLGIIQPNIWPPVEEIEVALGSSDTSSKINSDLLNESDKVFHSVSVQIENTIIENGTLSELIVVDSSKL